MGVCIKIKGNRAKIFGEIPHSILYRLDYILSYRPIGIEFSPSVKNGRWDGRFRLLTRKLEFSVGLVERVKAFFESENFSVSIEDLNEYVTYNGFDITERLKELGKSPRDYQKKAAEIALNKKRGIIKVCTGGGKTLIAGLIAAKAGGKVVVLVIGKDLLYQFHSFFEKIFQKDVGMVGDGICNIKDITVASIWTVGQAYGMKGSKMFLDDDIPKEKGVNKNLFKDIRDMVNGANVTIMDEVHAAAAQTMQKIGVGVSSKYCLGMSASPWRDDGADLLIESIFGEIIVSVTASELISKGFLVKPIIRFLPVPKMSKPGKNYRTIYKNYIVNNKVRNDMIVKGGIRLVEQGFVTMILFKEIQHGETLYDIFIDKGIEPLLLNGKMSSKVRNEGVEKIINGECNLILASTIFDIGIDFPNLGALVLAGSGKSSVRAMQRIGRILRTFEGKEIAPVIDFNDNCRYLRDHSKARKNMYSKEPGFAVEWR